MYNARKLPFYLVSGRPEAPVSRQPEPLPRTCQDIETSGIGIDRDQQGYP